MALSRFAILVLAVVLVLSGCARRVTREPAPASPAPPAPAAVLVDNTAVERSITVDGVARTYLLFAPASSGDVSPQALVVNLHGYNSDARQQEQVSQMSQLAVAEGFVVVYPQALGDPPSWKFGERAAGQADVAFLRAVIAEVQVQHAIDPRRIYVAGISNGAEMAYHVACELSDTIAAFATVAGGYPPVAQCAATRPIPAVAFHGTSDRLLPYDGKPPLLPVEAWAAEWAQHNGCDATPEVTQASGEVTWRQWSQCQAGADVELYTITGKGHSWPGSAMPASITTQAISATELIWTFFAAHPLP